MTRLPIIRLARPLAAFLVLALWGTIAHANHIVVCKVNDATNPVPAGSMFSFTITNVPAGYVEDGVVVTGTSGSFELTVDGPCQDLPNIGAGSHTITEAVPAGDQVTAITVDPPDRLDTGSLNLTLGTVSVEAVDTSSTPTTVTFTDAVVPSPPPPPPPGDQGCTPGYWKQSQHFDSWVGLTQSQTVDSVFTGALSSLGSESLLTALQGGGGTGLLGAEKILLRAAVAALLNANSIDYPYAYADIVTAVNNALASGDRDTVLGLGGVLDAANNGQGGCPLN